MAIFDNIWCISSSLALRPHVPILVTKTQIPNISVSGAERRVYGTWIEASMIFTPIRFQISIESKVILRTQPLPGTNI